MVVLDSTVRGGETDYVCCTGCDCPPAPQPSIGGEGGPGIVADSVFVANSVVEGGRGARVLAYPAGNPYSPIGPVLECLPQKDGEDFVVNEHHPLYDTISGPPRATSGAVYPLTVALDGFDTGVSFLFASLGAGNPVGTSQGWVFLDLPSAVLLLHFLAPAHTVVPIGVPADPSLLGLRFGFQAIDGLFGLTRPVFAVVTPW